MIHLLYRALESPSGTEIETNNRKLLRARLYKIMQKHPIDFTELAIVFPADPTRLWIMKKHPDEPDEESFDDPQERD